MEGLVAVTVLTLALAWANGANDVSKGVATLAAESGASALRVILWGSFWTLLGGCAAVLWGGALLKTFGGDFIAQGVQLSLPLIAAVLIGTCTWVAAASWFGWPVSTTHALLGGIVGGVLMMSGPDGLRAAVVANKALVPLLLSPLLAVAVCAALLLVSRWVAARVPQWREGCCDIEEWRRDPFVCAPSHVMQATQAPGTMAQQGMPTRRILAALHWLSGGVTSFARALNDVPKIAALLIVALAMAPELPEAQGAASGVVPIWPLLAVALVMGLGSVWGGYRVLRLLSTRITTLRPFTGLVANSGTSLLVLSATAFGLPVSTTHVSTGALLGIRWTEKSKPNEMDALKPVLLAWCATAPVVGTLTALVFFLLNK